MIRLLFTCQMLLHRVKMELKILKNFSNNLAKYNSTDVTTISPCNRCPCSQTKSIPFLFQSQFYLINLLLFPLSYSKYFTLISLNFSNSVSQVLRISCSFFLSLS